MKRAKFKVGFPEIILLILPSFAGVSTIIVVWYYFGAGKEFPMVVALSISLILIPVFIYFILPHLANKVLFPLAYKAYCALFRPLITKTYSFTLEPLIKIFLNKIEKMDAVRAEEKKKILSKLTKSEKANLMNVEKYWNETIENFFYSIILILVYAVGVYNFDIVKKWIESEMIFWILSIITTIFVIFYFSMTLSSVEEVRHPYSQIITDWFHFTAKTLKWVLNIIVISIVILIIVNIIKSVDALEVIAVLLALILYVLNDRLPQKN